MRERSGLLDKKTEANGKDISLKTRKVNLAQPSGSPADCVLFLQRTIGNQGVERMIKLGALQTKLRINHPGDKYEQEADAISKQIVKQQETGKGSRSGINLTAISVQQMIRRQETSFPEDAEEKLEELKQVQLKGKSQSIISSELEHRLDMLLAGTGYVLPQQVQMRMEESFAANFDHVRIHTDSESAQISRLLDAEAFTYGNDIYFGANKFDPATKNGVELLAHELTHTLQQTGIQRKTIQRRGGTTIGDLSINTNVINAGLIAGHAWLAYTPLGGPMTTYGTWGNRTPIGLHRDLELGYTPAVIRSTALDASDYTELTSFTAANNDWGYINNCASFAARGWRAVTGELLSYTNWLGIPNPSSLGAGIVTANGGKTGTLATTASGTGPSSSGGSSTGSSTSSSGSSSAGSSGESSGSSL